MVHSPTTFCFAELHIVEGGDHDVARDHAGQVAPLIERHLTTAVSPPPALAFRQATSSEAAALTTLARRSKAHWGYSEEFMRACEDELTYRPDQIARGDVWFVVGELDGVVVGFYALRLVSAREYELEALFIEPGQIRQGRGRALLEHGKATVRSLGGEALVIQGDPHAEGFYLAMGGERIGTRESASVPNRQLPLFRIAV